jgi:hypothetical protein
MALRACVIEGKGDCSQVRLAGYQHIMRSLWEEISELADFDKVLITNFYLFQKKSHQSQLYYYPYYTQNLQKA